MENAAVLACLHEDNRRRINQWLSSESQGRSKEAKGPRGSLAHQADSALHGVSGFHFPAGSCSPGRSLLWEEEPAAILSPVNEF